MRLFVVTLHFIVSKATGAVSHTALVLGQEEV